MQGVKEGAKLEMTVVRGEGGGRGSLIQNLS